MKITALTSILILALALVFLNSQRLKQRAAAPLPAAGTQETTPLPSGNCTPTFQDGGGPYYRPNSPFRENIAPTAYDGDSLVVTGKVLANDCVAPMAGVVLDIWQANASGSYEDEWYRGQITTESDGWYRFETVVPKGYGEGTGYRPPHIHFKVFQNGRELVTSQMFLPTARNQGIEEAYIMKVETRNENGNVVHYGSHDIILP